MKKIAICVVPYLTNDSLFDLFKKGIKSIRSKKYETHLFAVANYLPDQYKPFFDDHFDHYEINNPNKLSVACNKAFKIALEEGYETVVYINQDIEMGENTLDNLLDYFTNQSENLITSGISQEWANIDNDYEFREEFGVDFSMFAFGPQMIKEVGWFDENFKRAYFEDNDLARRTVNLGKKLNKISTAPFFHFASGTIKLDPTRAKDISNDFEENKRYYISKHGGEPDRERFTKPFNGAESLIKKYNLDKYHAEIN